MKLLALLLALAACGPGPADQFDASSSTAATVCTIPPHGYTELLYCCAEDVGLSVCNLNHVVATCTATGYGNFWAIDGVYCP